MDTTLFPTKGNLIATKHSLELASMGFELLDKKRNILVREMMGLLDKAKEIQSQINETFANAYMALQKANITMGVISDIANATDIEDKLSIKFRSIMGVEIPIVSIKTDAVQIPFGMYTSNSMLDEAYISFIKVKHLCALLAEIENSVYYLADAIKKTKKRANALKNIIIPKYESTLKFISDSLEEKDREEFTRLKVIKKRKTGL